MMQNNQISLDLAVIIVNDGKARKIIKFAKSLGARGATVYCGFGITKASKILEFLELYNIKKEIVVMINESKLNQHILNELNDKFKLKKPNHGIAFSIPISALYGTKKYKNQAIKKGNKTMSSQAIFTIVDRGKAEEVINAAKLAGAKGGTIINARGSGIHETEKIFNIDISPEKEVILIISDERITYDITQKISESLEMDKPGNGIIFVQEISKTYGLRI